MGQDLPAGPLAVYIHHPFCLQPCPYCSFFKRPWSLSAQESYLGSLLTEAELWEKHLGRRIQASSLYFGGGTPSLLKPEDLLRLCACFDLGGTELLFKKEGKRKERVSLKQRDRGTKGGSTMRQEEMRECFVGESQLGAGRVTRNAYRVTSFLKQRDRGTEGVSTMRHETDEKCCVEFQFDTRSVPLWVKSKRPADPVSEIGGRRPLELQRGMRRIGIRHYKTPLSLRSSVLKIARPLTISQLPIPSRVSTIIPPSLPHPSFHLSSFLSTEITLEVNPIQITEEYVRGLKRTPVNRLSVGVQSLRDEALRYLGRRHKGDSIPGRIKLLRDAGYDNISLDLMYGLPGMGLDELQQDLEAFLALEPEHISCYLLSLEEDSELGKLTDEGKSPALPDDESCAQQYELIRKVLGGAGFHHYEISNFARPGFEGRHNLAYWRSQPYLALGASAAGWLPPRRYTNPCDLEGYSSMIAAGELMRNAEDLSDEQAEADEIMMGLRLLEGIELKAFEERHLHAFGRGKERERDKLLKLGLLEITEGRIRLTPAALFVSNAVIGELL